MKNAIRLLFGVLVFAGTSAFAIEKQCFGDKNGVNTLGDQIIVEITDENVEVISARPGGYEDTMTKYPFVALVDVNDSEINAHGKFLKYQGGDINDYDGYRFLLEPKLKEKGSGRMLVRQDSGPEGTLDAEYACEDLPAPSQAK